MRVCVCVCRLTCGCKVPNTLRLSRCTRVPDMRDCRTHMSMQYTRDFKIFRILSDCRPAIRPTSTRSMAPKFSHSKKLCVYYKHNIIICMHDVKAEGASLSTPSFIIFSPFYKLNEEKGR